MHGMDCRVLSHPSTVRPGGFPRKQSLSAGTSLLWLNMSFDPARSPWDPEPQAEDLMASCKSEDVRLESLETVCPEVALGEVGDGMVNASEECSE